MRRIAFLSHIDVNLYLFRLHIMKKLKIKDWDVFAIIPEGKYFNKFSKYSIKTVSYKISRKSFNPLKEIKVILELTKILGSLKPHIIHTYVVKSNIYGSIASRIAHIPIVINSITGLGSFYTENTKKAIFIRKIIGFLYKFSFSYSKKVVFQNPDDLVYFIEKSIIPIDKAYLIRGSGVDIEKFSPSSKKRGPIFKVILISRLIKHKGVIEFCESAKILQEKYKNIEFLLVGGFYDSNFYAVSREYIETLEKEGVITFLGWRDDIKELIGDADLFVLPSLREGIPNTPLEAMAMKKPIITTDVPGCREVIEDGVNGYKIKPKNIDMLVDKIRKLYENRAFSKKMGIFGRKKTEKEFSKEKIVNMHIKLYEKYNY